MRAWFACNWLVAFAFLFVFAGSAAADEESSRGLTQFNDYVEPLLKQRCYDCHSHETGEANGGLVLDSRAGWSVGGDSGPAVVPGQPEKSLLIEAVGYDNEDLQMPPDGKLSDDEIAALVKWVKLGAADPRGDGKAAERATVDIEQGRKFWSFQPLQKASPPPVNRADWPRDDIDRFLLARLEQEGLSPSTDAAPAILLRRVYYDLTGLPPSPTEVDDFQKKAAADMDAALAKVVERLLNSAQFGEKWGRHWLDLARYADSNGSSFNPPFRSAWRYRNLVIDAYNRDLPYDRFVAMQIAGDLLPYASQQERDENLTASAYLMLGSKVLGLFDKEQLYLDVADEQIDTIGKSMLGLTLGCARCHDHKFDPLPQSDYYALAGIFTSTVTLDDRLGGAKEDESDWSRRGLGPGGDERLREFLRKNRYQWIKATQKRFQAQKRIGELKDASTDEERAELEKARAELKTYSDQLDELAAAMPPYVLAPREVTSPADTALRIRGVPASKGDLVPRGFLQVAAFPSQPSVDRRHSGRLELAEWIASPEHPLTARVYVNRIWKHLFREGLVRTVDNFGARGEAPTQPQLLDYLAARFIDDGWSTKRLIRSLVLSRAYRMSSTNKSSAAESDPENRRLWRQNARRLEPEEIRDTLLLISGRLDASQGAGMIDHLPIGDISNLGEALEIGDNRRTVYQPVFRTLEPDVLQIFDFANSAVTIGDRPKTIVAPQALYLLNSPLVQDSCVLAAKRITAEAPRENADELIKRAFSMLIGRRATPSELEILDRYLEKQYEGPEGPTDHDVSKLVQTILGSTQFQFLP
ncbi:MAG: PSD1 and planctomycete cytochrome C domain-containing protein [Pirellulaceae bacterium]